MKPMASGLIKLFAPFVMALLGCSSSAPEGAPAAQSSPATHLSASETRPFDFYLLNLSWSPEYCHMNPGSAECAEHPGFVIHGLWPQNNDGSYPRNCPAAPGPTSDALWRGLFPTGALAQHEWESHGTCTGLSVGAYFDLIRRAREQVRIPPDFAAPASPRGETPDQILTEFAEINSAIPPAAFALSCGHNYLTAIEVCFDKNLRATACSGIRSCRANYVKITPRLPTAKPAVRPATHPT